MESVKYPLCVPTFETLRKHNCIYTDKTAYIYDLVTTGSSTYFLSRPHGFGKTLLISTLEAYFKGKKELFEGLAIYELEKDWETYPVLRFDFCKAQASDPKKLEANIYQWIQDYAREFDVTLMDESVGAGPLYGSLIKEVSNKKGKQVVVLIDEYDKGIHEFTQNEETVAAYQDILRPFFSQIKAMDEYLRFCFITGVSSFRNYTRFSDSLSPDDISIDPAYAAICGFTHEELLDNYQDGIQKLAKAQGIAYEHCVDLLEKKYGGYRFTIANELVFNPFSILNCLNNLLIENYWVASDAHKALVDYLKKTNFNLLMLDDLWTSKNKMEGTYTDDDPVPLLYQNGYLTIKEYEFGMYKLGIPNEEVRSALVEDLIPRYMNTEEKESTDSTILKIRQAYK